MKLWSLLLLFCMPLVANAQDSLRFVRFDKNKNRDALKIQLSLGFGENLPDSYSLEKYLPSIPEKSDIPYTGGAYYLATIEYSVLAGLEHKEQIDALAYDPYYLFESSVRDSLYYNDSVCKSIYYFEDVCESLVKTGVKRQLSSQLDCGDNVAVKESYKSILEFTEVYNIHDKYGSWEETSAAIKQSLTENHPVLVNIHLPRRFWRIKSNGMLSPYPLFLENPEQHSVGSWSFVIVGYDDNKEEGCFKLANYWGESWGKKGFFFLRYKDLVSMMISGYKFDTKLAADINSEGCVLGDCENGYGVKSSDEGTFEGVFENGELKNGVFIVNSENPKISYKYLKKLDITEDMQVMYSADDEKKKSPLGYIKK